MRKMGLRRVYLGLCSRPRSWGAASPALCPNTSDPQTPFRLERGHLQPRNCQSPPSSRYLPAEVCKKVIFATKLAFRSWRLNKQTCDHFIAQGLQAAGVGVSESGDGRSLTVGCLTMAVLSILFIQ